jgi:hypothetical protein
MSERYPFHFVPSCAECGAPPGSLRSPGGAPGSHPTTAEPQPNPEKILIIHYPKPETIECLECRRIVERHLTELAVHVATEMEKSLNEIDETIHENWLKQGGPGS